MHPLTPDQIRSSLVNCSRGQAKALTLPPVDQIDWGNLDYLGWRDSRAPLRAVLVAERPEGPVGVALRIPNAGARPRASAMCNLCQCTQPADGVVLFSAAKAGESGRLGNSVGTYICADLACSLYLRGLLPLEMKYGLGVPLQERVDGLQSRLERFLASVHSS